eukprot:SAG11_NODE_17049_length_530_cov_0.726218_1_plen_66_part_10
MEHSIEARDAEQNPLLQVILKQNDTLAQQNDTLARQNDKLTQQTERLAHMMQQNDTHKQHMENMVN